VELGNCGKRTQVCLQCVNWPWPRCTHFDIGNDAWLEPRNIHVVGEVPKFVVLMVSRVQLFCILAVQKMCCCNPRGHESEPRQTTVGAVSRFAGDSK
jgi:hypothetical protein